jgi:hypothetical protein
MYKSSHSMLDLPNLTFGSNFYDFTGKVKAHSSARSPEIVQCHPIRDIE